jgi:hypothetical protein
LKSLRLASKTGRPPGVVPGKEPGAPVPFCGNAHIAQPAVGDCLVLEEIDDRSAVDGVHIHKGMIVRRLGHLPPEKLLLLGRDVKEVAIRANCSGLGGWDILDEHRGGEGTKSTQKERSGSTTANGASPGAPWRSRTIDMVLSCVVQYSTLEYQKLFWVVSNLYLYHNYHVR